MDRSVTDGPHLPGNNESRGVKAPWKTPLLIEAIIARDTQGCTSSANSETSSTKAGS